MKKMMFVFAIICILIFGLIYYIFNILGNNKNRSQEEIVENILNRICNYEAYITVEVFSNKSQNIYEMYQLVEGDKSKLIVKSPKEIENLILENDGNDLKISNSKLNVKREYENYSSIFNNNLFLNTFSKYCKDKKLDVYKKDEEIVIEVKLDENPNTYAKYEELHFNLKKDIPTELVIKDKSKETSIRIIYNDIKIK